MIWRKHSDLPEDAHAFLGGSNYAWLNYSEDKLVETYLTRAAELGTKLHEYACNAITLRRIQPEIRDTVCMFINDSIKFNMRPEQIIYYSKNAFGKADAISFENNFLRIFDLKTGKIPGSLKQLEIYAAYFCLEYDIEPIKMEGIELRIYQFNNILIGNPGVDVIAPIMDKIVTFDRIISELKEGLYV